MEEVHSAYGREACSCLVEQGITNIVVYPALEMNAFQQVLHNKMWPTNTGFCISQQPVVKMLSCTKIIISSHMTAV